MRKLSTIIKSKGLICFVPNADQFEIEIRETQHYYFATESVDYAKKLFHEHDRVIQGNRHELEISKEFAGLALIGAPKNFADLHDNISKVSEVDSVVIYRYDEIFDDSNLDELRQHHEQMKMLKLKLMQRVSEGGKKYIIALKSLTTLLNIQTFEEFTAFFVGPIIEMDHFNGKLFHGKIFKSNGYHPFNFTEKKRADWKNDYFNDQVSIVDKLFSENAKPRFMGGTIKSPNKEQAAILMASGRFDKEITLEDGRLMVFKGTEKITTDDKPKLNLDGEVEALRRIQVRQTVVYGLDMTNGEFVSFE